MADTIERLEVLIEANTRSYENAMKKLQTQTATALKAATKSVNEHSKSVQELGHHMELVGETAKLALASFGLGVGLEGIAKAGEAIRELVKSSGELVKISEQLGVTTDAMQALSFAAKVTDTDFDSLKKGLGIFNKNLGQASQGQGELLKVLKANHVALSGDLNTDLRNYANLIQHAGNQEQRARLETIAFGKAGGDLNEILTKGAGGLDEFTKKARDAGAIIDEKLLRETADLNRIWNEFGQTLSSFVRGAILGTIGLLNDLTNAAVEAANKMPKPPAGATVGPDKSNPLSSNFGTGMAAHIPGLTTRIPGMPGAPPIPIGQPGSAISIDPALAFRQAAHGGNRGPYNPGGGTTILPEVADPKIAAAEAAYRKLAAAIGLETTNLTASSREQFIANEAAKLGIDATPGQIAGIKKVAAVLYDQKKALEDNRAAADLLANAMFSALDGIVSGSDTAAQALKKLVDQLLQAVLQAELLGTGPLAGILGTAPKTAGAPAGLLGSLGSAIIGALPKFAAGGTLGAGEIGIVGERGPELARGPMSITPGRGGGGGAPPVFQIIVNGARGNTEIRQMVAQGVTAGLRTDSEQRDRARVLAG